MAYLATLFFIGFIYLQGRSLWSRETRGEFVVFLLATLLAAYYSLGQLSGFNVLNPADILNSIFKPLVVLIFG